MSNVRVHLMLRQESLSVSKSKNKSDAAWLETVMQKGTHEDRISAMQLKVHQSPVHSMAYLNLLIGIVQKKALRESASVISMPTSEYSRVIDVFRGVDDRLCRRAAAREETHSIQHGLLLLGSFDAPRFV